MPKQEINHTLYGEMLDMISCLNIENGVVEYVAPPQKMAFEDAMKYK